MNKCFLKKVLAVIIGVTLIGFIMQGMTSVLNQITIDDKLATGSAVHIGKLVNINLAIFGLLAILVIIMICVNLIENKAAKFCLEGIVYAVAITIMVVGVAKLWNFRDEIINESSGGFYVTHYQMWQSYFSNLISVVLFAFGLFTSLFTNSLISCKKEEK